MRVIWTERRRVIGDALTNRIPLATVEQFARALWPASASALLNVERDIQQLVDAGYLKKLYVLGVDELNLTEPVVRWTPGDSAPDFHAASTHLQSRWTQRPRAMHVLIAAPNLVGLFGGFGGKLRHREQVRHDLHVAQIFFHYLKPPAPQTPQWKSEARLSYEVGRRRKTEHGDGAAGRLVDKLPDAALCSSDDGSILRVIEFGGAYPAMRVEKLHRYCDQGGYEYELW